MIYHAKDIRKFVNAGLSTLYSAKVAFDDRYPRGSFHLRSGLIQESPKRTVRPRDIYIADLYIDAQDKEVEFSLSNKLGFVPATKSLVQKSSRVYLGKFY